METDSCAGTQVDEAVLLDIFPPDELRELRRVFTDGEIAELPSILTKPGEMEMLHLMLRGDPQANLFNNFHCNLPGHWFRSYCLREGNPDEPQTPCGNDPNGHSERWLRQTYRQFIEQVDTTLMESGFDMETHRRLDALGSAVQQQIQALCEQGNVMRPPSDPVLRAALDRLRVIELSLGYEDDLLILVPYVDMRRRGYTHKDLW